MPLLARLFFIFLLLQAATGPGWARVALIDPDVGLSDKHITSITRDSRGLMWVGTRHGLCAYDGYRFIPFKTPGLKAATVNRLHYVPETDILWISCDTSLFMLHCRELRLQRASIPPEGALTATTLGSDNALYACFRSGHVFRIDTAGTPRLLERMPQGLPAGDYCSRISADPTGLLLLRGEQSNRYFSLDPHSGAITALPHETGSVNLSFIKTASRWRAMFGEERLFLQSSSAAPGYPSPQEPHYWLNNIIDVGADPAGQIYALGRPSKLYRLHPGRSAIDTLTSEFFTGRTFNCFYADPDGIFWVGTNKGLLKISTDTRFFTQLLQRSPPVSVRSIAADDQGHFYTGTYSGLFRSSDDGHSWDRISGQIPNRIISVSGPWVYFVGGDSSLYRIHKTDGSVSTGFWSRPGPERREIGEAYALFRQGGRLWIGGSNGLFCYDTETESFAEWNGNGQFPPHVHVNFISGDDAGGLRVCTNAGLFEFDAGGRLRARFGTGTRPALSDERILHVTQDSAGRLWLCTSGGGINIISPDRKSVSVLNTQHGLSNNETYQIIWQGRDKAWISTFNGLSRYDLRDRSFRNYYSSDGLTTNEFNHNAFLLDQRQRIWFGTINGINRFAPEEIPSTARRAVLFVSSLSKWDSRLRALREIPAADTNATIELLPQDHSLSFTLGLTDYSLTENNTFMYRLPGVFDEWVQLEGAQALRLDGLAAGTYTLEIRALDGRGIPASNMLRYRILVREFFYKTWWFYLGLLVVTTLLIWGGFRLRLQNIKRVQRLRQQIASDLHDEVGSLLTRITMTSENLRYSRNPEPEKAAKLEKIAALSRNASSSMSDILWAIDARNDYTGNLSDRIQEHAEEMLMTLDAELQFDIRISQRKSISSQFRQQLYLIYKEAINNVAKHSHAGQVRILYHHDERGFRLEVCNDGLREAERSSVRSQGLKNMEMRARRIGARIEIRNEDGWFNIVVTGR